MRPRRTVPLALGASLCGALLLGAAGPAAAARPAEPAAPAAPAVPRTVQDLESLLEACQYLLDTSFGGWINPDGLAKVSAELDTLLGAPTPDTAQPGTWPGMARATLKKEVDALVAAASEGDWIKVIGSLQTVPKAANDLLFAVGLSQWIDSLPPAPEVDPATAQLPQTPQ
ncbi:hypothetical protein ACFWZ2_43240 [Streptomyces sp. NPDC059002]|uniref:hypothetical protein n=1 Tax=Streptomyces sp. NPDC059002 TaxID=3346690 RepID=UPI0036B885FD